MGSLIGDLEGVERRKQLSTAALNKLYHVWVKGNKLKATTKIKLYKSLVKSILLYNCSTWALTLTEEEQINASHRKQMKKVLNIKIPVKIRLQLTDDLVKITELARDREQWRKLSARIEKAAEASQTMNWDATRQ